MKKIDENGFDYWGESLLPMIIRELKRADMVREYIKYLKEESKISSKARFNNMIMGDFPEEKTK